MRAPSAAAGGASSILAAPSALVAGFLALVAALLLLAAGGDRMRSDGGRAQIKLPQLMLWVWDRDDDLRFIDQSDTGAAFLAATVTLGGDGVVLEPRRNPLILPERAFRAAVVHVETDRAAPPALSREQLRRFVEAVSAVGDEVPSNALQIDFEALTSQRAFLIDAIAGLRERLPGKAISATALASWCNESWTGRLAADEVVPMLFRMGYDGRRLRARLENGGDFRSETCRSSLGVATNELPAALPPGRRIYVFNPRRWSAETYNSVRARMLR